MRICENIAAALVAVTVPAGFVAVLGIEADKGAWAYWLIVLVMVLQLTAMGLVKMGARSDNPSTAVRRSPSLYTREGRAVGRRYKEEWE